MWTQLLARHVSGGAVNVTMLFEEKVPMFDTFDILLIRMVFGRLDTFGLDFSRKSNPCIIEKASFANLVPKESIKEDGMIRAASATSSTSFFVIR